MKWECISIDSLAIQEIATDNLENEVAFKNFSFNKPSALFPRVNKTVAFDIYAWCYIWCHQVSNVSDYV